jgi:hypothetical protein
MIITIGVQVDVQSLSRQVPQQRATMSMKTDNGSRQDGPILQQADNNLGRLSEKNSTTIKSNFIVQNKRNDLNLNLNEMEIQFDGKVRLGV